MDLFVYGTLVHEGLREVVLGGAVRVEPAQLPGVLAHWRDGEDYPTLCVAEAGEARGLVLCDLSEAQRARLDFFEAGFPFDVVEVEVLTAEGARRVHRYRAADEGAGAGEVWSLEDWGRAHGARWVAAAREIMGYLGEIDGAELARRMPMIQMRAGSAVRAAPSAPTTQRAGRDVARDVEVVQARRPYSNYFVLEEHDLKFRRFDGEMSEPVNRAGFIGGDAVTVLPYDPLRDEVLLVEQFRIGPYMRGDRNPWMLEPIAGRVDHGESVESTARREAVEEAGLELGALHYVSGHYPSPGAVSEYVYAFVGIADLSDKHGHLGGLATEHEDIRSHVVSFERLMELVTTDEAGVGPLVVSAYWLALHRDRLRASA